MKTRMSMVVKGDQTTVRDEVQKEGFDVVSVTPLKHHAECFVIAEGEERKALDWLVSPNGSLLYYCTMFAL